MHFSTLMNKFLIAAVCLLAFVMTAVWMWPDAAFSPDGSDPNAPSDLASGPAPFPAATLSKPESLSSSAPADQPYLEVLPDGRLKVAPPIRAPLDQYLAEHRHQSLEELVEGFKQTALSRLDEPAATEAVELMTRYAAYQLALQELQHQKSAAASESGGALPPILQLQQAHALREQLLGPELSQALYGDDQQQQQQRYLLARSQILTQTGMNAQERGEELAALQRQYPRSVVDGVEKLTQPR